jgi:BASS family bile acid:Na+ symporter
VEFAVQIVLPILLVGMMISLGLELTLEDFRRVFELRRAVCVGAIGQLIGLPLLGLGFGLALGLSPALAIGVAIITACPGSAPSNVFSFMGRGNLPLSISLTAISSVVTAFTLPLWVGLALRVHGDSGAGLPEMPIGPAVAQLLALTAVPVGIGMALRARAPQLADRARPHLRRGVVVALAAAVVGLSYLGREAIARDIATAGMAALGLAVLSLSLGYLGARLVRLDARDSFTVSIEVGLQNGALASLVVTNLLQRPEWIVFPGAYALLSLLPVCAWTFVASRRMDPRRAVTDPPHRA